MKWRQAGRACFTALVVAVLVAAWAPAAWSQEDPAAVENAGAGDYRYPGERRRDPFKSLLVLQEKTKDIALLPPIQQVDVAAFNVIGIIMDQEKGNRAMLKAPDGKTYVISKGDIVGKNEGEVVSISLSGIAVKEKFLDFMNRETFVNTVIEVSEKR